MFLNLLIPSYQKYIDIVVTQNTTFYHLLDMIIKKCKEFNFIFYKENIKCILNDILITENNWYSFRNHNQYKNINGIIIIISTPCKDHSP